MVEVGSTILAGPGDQGADLQSMQLVLAGGDDPRGKEILRQLVEQVGFEAIDVGPLKQAAGVADPALDSQLAAAGDTRPGVQAAQALNPSDSSRECATLPSVAMNSSRTVLLSGSKVSSGR